MSTLAEIEKAIEALPPEQWLEIRRWMGSRTPKVQPAGNAHTLPLVPATGKSITQQHIDDALDSD